MRLDRVTLRSFKGLSEFAAALAPGLNVVLGPNEAGKSSFLEALRAAFFESATTTSKAKVGRWVPWGTKAAPEVSVEFEAGGARYRVAKTFAKSKGKATLVDLASDATLADGPKHVDTRLGEILRMGDAAFLCSSWVEQGRIELALDEAGGREDLRARLREAGAGAASAVDVDKAVERRRRALSLPGAVRELRGKLDEASRHAERVAEAVGRWRKRDGRAEEAGERLEEIAKRLAEIVPRLDEDAKHRDAAAALERAKRELAAAKAALDAAEEAAGKIQESERHLTEAEASLMQARTRGEAAKEGLAVARAAARKAELDDVLAKASALGQEAERLKAVADSPALDRAELGALEAAAARVTEIGASSGATAKSRSRSPASRASPRADPCRTSRRSVRNCHRPGSGSPKPSPGAGRRTWPGRGIFPRRRPRRAGRLSASSGNATDSSADARSRRSRTSAPRSPRTQAPTPPAMSILSKRNSRRRGRRMARSRSARRKRARRSITGKRGRRTSNGCRPTSRTQAFATSRRTPLQRSSPATRSPPTSSSRSRASARRSTGNAVSSGPLSRYTATRHPPSPRTTSPRPRRRGARPRGASEFSHARSGR
ncbi:MAG: AAA family ATPase [Planctomycetota bacterium]